MLSGYIKYILEQYAKGKAPKMMSEDDDEDYFDTELDPYIGINLIKNQVQKPKKCICGAEKVDSKIHSLWCEKYEQE